VDALHKCANTDARFFSLYLKDKNDAKNEAMRVCMQASKGHVPPQLVEQIIVFEMGLDG
jgi:hypothetical protein